MGVTTPRDGVAIAEVTAYGIALLLSTALFGREGLRRGAAWLYLILFSILRIIGGALQITTINSPGAIHLFIGAAICNSTGFSLLYIITIEILTRINERCYKYYSETIETIIKVYIFLQLLIIVVAFILGIVGGVRSGTYYTSHGIYKTGILSEVSTILFIIVYGLIIGSAVFALNNYGRGILRDKPLLVAILISLPLLLVRLIYSCLAYISKDISFNPLYGGVGYYVGLEFLMELLITIFYISGGFANYNYRMRRRRRRSRRSSRTTSLSYDSRSPS